MKCESPGCGGRATGQNLGPSGSQRTEGDQAQPSWADGRTLLWGTRGGPKVRKHFCPLSLSEESQQHTLSTRRKWLSVWSCPQWLTFSCLLHFTEIAVLCSFTSALTFLYFLSLEGCVLCLNHLNKIVIVFSYPPKGQSVFSEGFCTCLPPFRMTLVGCAHIHIDHLTA